MKSIADPYDQYIDMNEYQNLGDTFNPQPAPQTIAAPAQNSQQQASMNLLRQLSGSRTPVDTFRDVGAGLLTGGQNLLSSLRNPQFDMTKKLGLDIPEQEIDFNKMIGSGKPGAGFIQGLSQYAPGVAMGGRRLLGQIAGNAGWGATQASPEQENLGGLLPNGRMGAAIEGAAIGAIPFGIPAAARGIKSGYQYLNPESDAKAFIESLGGGAKTAEENIGQLGQRIKFGYESNKQDALMTKQNVLDTVGNKRLDVLPGLTEEKIAKIFTKDKEQFTEENISGLQKALNSYFKNRDIDKFVQKGEDIFGSQGLTTKQLDKLDEMLNLQESNYLSKGKADYLYNHDLKKLHSAFERKPTFQNADSLQSQLGNDIGYFQRLERKGNLQPADKPKLDDLVHARDLLIKDMNGFLKQTNPKLKDEYNVFREKWRENVVPYSSSDLLRGFTSKKPKGGFTPSNIASEFSFPDVDASKVLGDIGQSGKNNVLFNELQKSESFNPKELATALTKMKNLKGYQQHISPEQEKLIEQLVKRQGRREFLGTAGASLGAALTLPVHPALGAAIGFGLNKSSPLLIKALQKITGRKQ